MSARWLPRFEDGDVMRPCLLIGLGAHYLFVRFGHEKHKAFTERLQGTRGIPIRWRYLFGGRLSFRYENTNSE